MKKKSGLIAGIVILILLCIGAGVLYQNMKPAASEGEKHITVTVIHGDQTENVFEFDTDAKYLGEVLVLWSSIFVTLMANKIGGLQFGIYRNCQISSRVFHTAVAALPLTKANRSDFE